MILRELFEAAEPIVSPNLPPRKKQKVKNAMIKHVLSNKHWDAWAKKRHPDKFRRVDWDEFGDDMAETWEIDRYEQPDAFRERLEAWAEARYNEVVEKITKQMTWQDGKILAHRVMFVPYYQLRDWRSAGGSHNPPLGLYWTYDLDGWHGAIGGAYAIWAKTAFHIGYDVLIEALVPPTSVDWEITIMANMDWFSGDVEHELRLIQGAPLEVVKMEIYENEDRDHSEKIAKTYNVTPPKPGDIWPVPRHGFKA